MSQVMEPNGPHPRRRDKAREPLGDVIGVRRLPVLGREHVPGLNVGLAACLTFGRLVASPLRQHGDRGRVEVDHAGTSGGLSASTIDHLVADPSPSASDRHRGGVAIRAAIATPDHRSRYARALVLPGDHATTH
jgi:hypothetical protein